MTKRERVMAAFRGERPDRVPVGFWYHFPSDCVYGEKAVKAHLDFFRSSGTDLCKVMNDNLCPEDPTIRTASDWDHFNRFSMQEDFICRQLDLIHEIALRMEDKPVLLATVHGLVACAYHIMGGGELYDRDGTLLGRLVKEDPEAMHRCFSELTEYIIEFGKMCIAAGADGIYYASLGGERRMFTDAEFAEFIAPHEIRILNELSNVPCFNVLHMCKGDLNLERYREYPAEVLNWGVYEGNISLAEGRGLFGIDKVYLGGMDDRDGVLVHGRRKEITAAAQDVIRELGWRRFILGADCTLPSGLSSNRIRAAVAGTEVAGD